MKDLSKVIRRPLITEQGRAAAVVVEVAPEANKQEIRQAVEHFFGVKVTQVRTMNCRGKVKRMGRFTGKRADWKKAIVTLAKDDSIDMFEVV